MSPSQASEEVEVKQKIQAVREVVRGQNLSDSQVLAVLQCFEYNVDQTIAAFLEGLLLLRQTFLLAEIHYSYCHVALCMTSSSPAGLGHSILDCKVPGKKRKNRKVVDQRYVSGAAVACHDETPASRQSSVSSQCRPVASYSSNVPPSCCLAEGRCGSLSSADVPSSVSTSAAISSHTVSNLNNNASRAEQLTATVGTSSVGYTSDRTREDSATGPHSATAPPSATGPQDPPSVLTKSCRDLQRQISSLTRLQSTSSSRTSCAIVTIHTAFDKLRTTLNSREAELVCEVEQAQQKTTEVLQSRLHMALNLKFLTEVAGTMTSSALDQLRQHIKSFVCERNIDQDLGCVDRFSCKLDDMVQSIESFGTVNPFTAVYAYNPATLPSPVANRLQQRYLADAQTNDSSVTSQRTSMSDTRPADGGLSDHVGTTGDWQTSSVSGREAVATMVVYNRRADAVNGPACRKETGSGGPIPVHGGPVPVPDGPAVFTQSRMRRSCSLDGVALASRCDRDEVMCHRDPGGRSSNDSSEEEWCDWRSQDDQLSCGDALPNSEATVEMSELRRTMECLAVNQQTQEVDWSDTPPAASSSSPQHPYTTGRGTNWHKTGSGPRGAGGSRGGLIHLPGSLRSDRTGGSYRGRPDRRHSGPSGTMSNYVPHDRQYPCNGTESRSYNSVVGNFRGRGKPMSGHDGPRWFAGFPDRSDGGANRGGFGRPSRFDGNRGRGYDYRRRDQSGDSYPRGYYANCDVCPVRGPAATAKPRGFHHSSMASKSSFS